MLHSFVAHYEEEYLASFHQQPLVWKSYIDDILVIWPYSKENFLNFFHGLKLVHSNLRFTMEIFYISIQFLDLTISKGVNYLRTGLLTTSIFFKHTNTFSYLHGYSYLSRHVLKGIAVHEIVQTLRSTSCPGYFRVIKRILTKNSYRRGFLKTAIKAAERIRFGMRECCLAPSDCKSLLHPIPIRTKYCNYVPTVGNLFQVAWERVFDDPVLSHYFHTARSQFGLTIVPSRIFCRIKTKLFNKNYQIGSIGIILFRNLINLSLLNARKHCESPLSQV